MVKIIFETDFGLTAEAVETFIELMSKIVGCVTAYVSLLTVWYTYKMKVQIKT